MGSSRTHTRVAVLLCAALVLRLAAGCWWQSQLAPDTLFGLPDSESYWELAGAIAHGQPYRFGENEGHVFRTPGYPLVLAPLFLVAGADPPVLAARALGAILGTLSVGGVMWLAWQLLDERAAWIAGITAAVYPEAVAMSTFVLSEAAFGPLLVLQLILWTVAWRCSGAGHRLVAGLGTGVVAALATLMRPGWLLFTPFAIAVGLAWGPDRKRHVLVGLTILVALSLGMAPWWIRNWVVTGRFVPTTLQTGASLYDGLNPAATGASDMRFVQRFSREQRQADAAGDSADESTFEFRLDRRMREAAITWALDHPGRVVQLMCIKFVRMWNVWPNAEMFGNWWMGLVLMVGYVPVAVCGVWGVCQFTRRGWPCALCLLPAVYLTIGHVIFVGSIRYRQPAMLAIIVLAAGAVAGSIRWGRTGCADSE